MTRARNISFFVFVLVTSSGCGSEDDVSSKASGGTAGTSSAGSGGMEAAVSSCLAVGETVTQSGPREGQAAQVRRASEPVRFTSSARQATLPSALIMEAASA